MTVPAPARAAGSLVQLRRPTPRRVALVGNPNTGKSTLFNALTGLRQRVANYPGVTVEVKLGALQIDDLAIDDRSIELVDLPGMYSLAGHTPDQLLALDVLLGRSGHGDRPKAIVVLADATNLERNLFLVSQLLELGVPTVIALTMADLAAAAGTRIDAVELERRLGAPVVAVVATQRRGLAELKSAIARALASPAPHRPRLLAELDSHIDQLHEQLLRKHRDLARIDVERALIDRGGALEKRLVERVGAEVRTQLEALRESFGGAHAITEREAEARYRWASETLDGVVLPGPGRRRWIDRVDRVVAHPLLGSLIFIGLMTLTFQAVFSWATPAMDRIDGATGAIAAAITRTLPAGALASLLADGVVAGVGAVVVFLPQIITLFAFLLVLEDSGYMARAAFMMDRLMRASGLSGQSFIPMLSSFACAVPGIMAARVIPSRRDRLATILAAPFMTCSARLPVYALLISAFVPDRKILAVLSIQGLVLLGLYLLGIASGVITALILKRTLLRGPTPTFLMEMPPYRWPDLRSVAIRLIERVRIFLRRAGTVIFVVAIVVWALAYFPHSRAVSKRFDDLRAQTTRSVAATDLVNEIHALDNAEAAAHLENSALGRVGQAVEPVFRPLGWDWRVASGVIAAFPAREVVLATLGTIYAVGSEVDEHDQGLIASLRNAVWPDGRPVFTLPMALGLMVFFALCLQCGATVAAIRRESGSWRWPIFAWCYMTGLAYLGALVTFQLGSWLQQAPLG